MIILLGLLLSWKSQQLETLIMFMLNIFMGAAAAGDPWGQKSI